MLGSGGKSGRRPGKYGRFASADSDEASELSSFSFLVVLDLLPFALESPFEFLWLRGSFDADADGRLPKGGNGACDPSWGSRLERPGVPFSMRCSMAGGRPAPLATAVRRLPGLSPP